MSKISKSPERYTFQSTKYIERCKEEGKDPREDYLNLYKSARQQDEENMIDPGWQKDNMEYDLRSTDWILEKVRGDNTYAQNLYAAMCNRDFIKHAVIPILKNQRWSCTWRHAGGIVADMQEKGDYIDWYCSGIRGDKLTDEEICKLTDDQLALYKESQSYVSEGMVTDEIRKDLFRLGWVVQDDDTDDVT